MSADPSTQLLQQALPALQGIHVDCLTVFLGSVGVLVVLVALDKMKDALEIQVQERECEQEYEDFKRRTRENEERKSKQEYFRNRLYTERAVEQSAMNRRINDEKERAKVWGEIGSWAREDKQD